MIMGPLVCRGNQLQFSTSLIPIKMNNACSKILVIKGKNIECKLNGLNQWIILQTAILRNWKKVLFKSINILITLPFYFSYINKKHPICCFPSPEKQRTAAFANILSSTGINYQAVDIYKLVSQARQAAEDILPLIQFSIVCHTNQNFELKGTVSPVRRQRRQIAESFLPSPGFRVEQFFCLPCSIQSGESLRQCPRNSKETMLHVELF